MRSLGRNFDLAVGFVPVDTQTGANTGKRVSMQGKRHATWVLFKSAGAGTDAPVATLYNHTANTGGTSTALAAITGYWYKSAATLAGTEAWARVDQAAATTLTFTGEATKQGIYVVEITADSMSDTYTHLSMDVADTGAAGAQLGCSFWILSDLAVQRKPSNLAATL